ncbi:hypothetical protein [Rathayibacter sp. VKM Ac-2630]|uniref:hypothetical protein n=1 Tax=Rathayibacter sp. VKM Ac-2630 TaxID=1938617 RepID=UPI000981503B|nr:hypothetical protein [Rathayibacter sp. VKM Ac-2630]OOB91202.1 hypothetical protein B0T42_07335 [Rathayibacter sp. VKM Ac-2630]
MTDKRKTFRFRPGKNHFVDKDRIFTFWEDQRVVRAGYERRNYVDLIAEYGTVERLPKENEATMMVRLDDDTVCPWSPLEAMPHREWAKRQRDRFRDRAKAYNDFLSTLDENGRR